MKYYNRILLLPLAQDMQHGKECGVPPSYGLCQRHPNDTKKFVPRMNSYQYASDRAVEGICLRHIPSTGLAVKILEIS